MLKKGQIAYSVLKGKCPRCQEGEFFKYPIGINPNKITQLHKNCPNCNLKYMMEPSFFYGAMYVNYGLTVAISVAVFIIAKIFIGLTLGQSLISIGVVLVLLAPVNLRLSRILWINFFIKYDPKYSSENLKKNE
jgi:uncharacterized protein (DUF983 family)